MNKVFCLTYFIVFLLDISGILAESTLISRNPANRKIKRHHEIPTHHQAVSDHQKVPVAHVMFPVEFISMPMSAIVRGASENLKSLKEISERATSNTPWNFGMQSKEANKPSMPYNHTQAQIIIEKVPVPVKVEIIDPTNKLEGSEHNREMVENTTESHIRDEREDALMAFLKPLTTWLYFALLASPLMSHQNPQSEKQNQETQGNTNLFFIDEEKESRASILNTEASSIDHLEASKDSRSQSDGNQITQNSQINEKFLLIPNSHPSNIDQRELGAIGEFNTAETIENANKLRQEGILKPHFPRTRTEWLENPSHLTEHTTKTISEESNTETSNKLPKKELSKHSDGSIGKSFSFAAPKEQIPHAQDKGLPKDDFLLNDERKTNPSTTINVGMESTRENDELERLVDELLSHHNNLTSPQFDDYDRVKLSQSYDYQDLTPSQPIDYANLTLYQPNEYESNLKYNDTLASHSDSFNSLSQSQANDAERLRENRSIYTDYSLWQNDEAVSDTNPKMTVNPTIWPKELTGENDNGNLLNPQTENVKEMTVPHIIHGNKYLPTSWIGPTFNNMDETIKEGEGNITSRDDSNLSLTLTSPTSNHFQTNNNGLDTVLDDEGILTLIDLVVNYGMVPPEKIGNFGMKLFPDKEDKLPPSIIKTDPLPMPGNISNFTNVDLTLFFDEVADVIEDLIERNLTKNETTEDTYYTERLLSNHASNDVPIQIYPDDANNTEGIDINQEDEYQTNSYDDIPFHMKSFNGGESYKEPVTEKDAGIVIEVGQDRTTNENSTVQKELPNTVWLVGVDWQTPRSKNIEFNIPSETNTNRKDELTNSLAMKVIAILENKHLHQLLGKTSKNSHSKNSESISKPPLESQSTDTLNATEESTDAFHPEEINHVPERKEPQGLIGKQLPTNDYPNISPLFLDYEETIEVIRPKEVTFHLEDDNIQKDKGELSEPTKGQIENDPEAVTTLDISLFLLDNTTHTPVEESNTDNLKNNETGEWGQTHYDNITSQRVMTQEEEEVVSEKFPELRTMGNDMIIIFTNIPRATTTHSVKSNDHRILQKYINQFHQSFPTDMENEEMPG